MRAPVGTMLRRGLWSPGGVAILISAGTLISVRADSTPTTAPAPTSPGPTDLQRVIYGCVNMSTGDVRALVPAPVSTSPPPSTLPICNSGELLIGWNQQGRPGANGANGQNGAPGRDGATPDVLGTIRTSLTQMIAPHLTDLENSLAALQAAPSGLNGLAEVTGSGTVAVPDNVKNVLVEAWGAGGGGSGATDATDPSQPCFGGAGGGAGAYIRQIVAIPQHRQGSPVLLSVTVGKGGTGGTAGARGGDGTATTMSITGGPEVVRAEGGAAGTPASQTAPGGTGGVGGTGASATNAVGRSGNPGGPGTTSAEGPPPVAAAPPPASIPSPPASSHTSSPQASIDQILKDLTLLPLLPASGAQHASGAAAPLPLPLPVPGGARTCGKGGAGGVPVRGSLDPVGAYGGQGGDQTTAASQNGAPGGDGYVLVLW